MIVIGLTGGIGSGKTTVGAMLKELGAAFIDADKVGHRLLREDHDLKWAIVAAFGEGILDADDAIDRRKLARIVFCDTAALETLNAITHPAISQAVSEEVAEFRSQGYKVAVVEAALLIEAGWMRQTDVIWLTAAPPEVVLDRLVNKMGYTEAEARARIACQTSNEVRRRYASAVIDTDLPMADLRHRVEELWRALKS
ncbi:dephospho-CoA kinase [Dehalogenimonas alkenigignens]|uniref:Dephospho-CoA kinase n=1 Tax=Dehalogenimonas alkenigignens TaxID=1217799 RepID=A0A0W0GI21_9CHLR|nr:dephospho-CoA kinase [Dehalogenimonas alkenigignens]KTB48221.1 dephospho-CoA kinase [Dehalogenimonas alkenigignens]PVV84459.1 dephospho-CoA kinase [Dehalogenimonas alkenigignens]